MSVPLPPALRATGLRVITAVVEVAAPAAFAYDKVADPVVAVLPVPVFCHEMIQTTGLTPAAPAVQLADVALTLAGFVNPVKSPVTKPYIASAAMSVIAMRMTVARTGDMAFLFSLRTLPKFIVEVGSATFLIKAYGFCIYYLGQI